MAFSYKTNISFALVFIPVKLHKVIRQNQIGFNMLDKKTMSRIKYKKTCEKCNGREVAPNDIVKGYNYDGENYIVFEKDELEKLKTPKDKTVTVDSFINFSQIDSALFSDSYYVEPTGAGKAYNLLVEILKKGNLAGVAKSIIGTNETVVVISAKSNYLILHTLYFASEVVPVPFTIGQTEITKKELEMAEVIVKSMTEEFELSKYKDEYSLRLLKAIEQKKAGIKITQVKGPAAPLQITDLFSALETSLKMLDKKVVKKNGEKPKTIKKSSVKKVAANE